jgi:hypothetical protein
MKARLLLAALATIALASCDLNEFLLDSDLLPGARQEAATTCCECLFAQVAPASGDQCSATGDAGPPIVVDGGEVFTPCLCEEHTPLSCADLLSAGGPVVVVGGCVDVGGPCESACDDVLAFPE